MEVERRRFLMSLTEVVVDGCFGFFEIELRENGKLVAKSETYDNFGEAIDDFAKFEHEWYDFFGIRANGDDEFHVYVDANVTRLSN